MASRAALMAQQVVSWTRRRAGRPDCEAAGRNRRMRHARHMHTADARYTGLRGAALPWTGLSRGHSTRDLCGAI